MGVSRQKKKLTPTVRNAETPGQTANVDLCFVPLTHRLQEKLPAVSGSSGKLVIQSSRSADKEPDYPGRVFEDDKLSYTSAMEGFVKASQEKDEQSTQPLPVDDEKMSIKAKKRSLHQEEALLRNQRRTVRQKRKQEDAAWKTSRQQRRRQQMEATQTPRQPRQPVDAQQWKQLRQHRKQTVEQRKQENIQWRDKRRQIKQRWSQLPIIAAWVAILVITDNCTRQCLGLPLFIAGAKVTGEAIVDALKQLLPVELKFLISDRGPQFRAKLFEKLALTQPFIHVLIARHRPQSNGIAERFVRTLKQWLSDKHWDDEHQLRQWLVEFLLFYNERPHQGLPGDLSPNELARRLSCHNCQLSD